LLSHTAKKDLKILSRHDIILSSKKRPNFEGGFIMQNRVNQLIAILLVGLMLLPILPVSVSAAANQGQITTSGGPRSTTWTEIALDETYVVMGLTATEVLGQPFGTLSEFAAAMAPYSGTDVIIFPVNFFVTGTPEVVGAIFSRGRIVSAGPQPWLNFGVGFTRDNEMNFFRGRLNNNAVYGYNWYASRFYMVYTAFNAFPHLIEEGFRLPLVPHAGLSQPMISNRLHRAFMGQRADGSFIVGNTAGASLHEMQDIAAHFNLVNATNIDGGASAGIWRNGEYLTHPGRPLPSVMFITNSRAPAAPPPTPSPTPPPSSSLPFHDVSSTDWFYAATRYVYETGLMVGMSPTDFSPQTGLSRAMVATVLHRLADEPPASFRPVFSDVPAGRWYSNVVTWAFDAGVVQGMGDGTFASHSQLTREQLAVMMHRFAADQGHDLRVPAGVNVPAGTNVWAAEAMRWAVHHNFIGPESPGGTATRATTAVFLHNYTVWSGD